VGLIGLPVTVVAVWVEDIDRLAFQRTRAGGRRS